MHSNAIIGVGVHSKQGHRVTHHQIPSAANIFLCKLNRHYFLSLFRSIFMYKSTLNKWESELQALKEQIRFRSFNRTFYKSVLYVDLGPD